MTAKIKIGYSYLLEQGRRRKARKADGFGEVESIGFAFRSLRKKLTCGFKLKIERC
jgi:hypothetical protein